MANGYTASFAESVAQVDVILPQSTSTQVNGSWVSVAQYERMVAKLATGNIASTGTITFQVRQAKDTSGTSAKALVAAAALGDTSDNTNIWLDIKGSDLDNDNGFSCVRIEIVAATAASLVFAELLGYVARYQPVTQPATVVQA